jgi:hypothetical protein
MMKRFGKYDNDFNALFECYSQVNSMVMERQLPSETREPTSISTGDSFPGIKRVKLFIQKPGRGADLANLINVSRIDSDDGQNGSIISGSEGEKTFNIATTQKTAQVKMIDSQGNIENDFVTTVAPRYDSGSGELTIIHVETL